MWWFVTVIFILTLVRFIVLNCFITLVVTVLCSAACLGQDTLVKEIFNLSVAFLNKQRLNKNVKFHCQRDCGLEAESHRQAVEAGQELKLDQHIVGFGIFMGIINKNKNTEF